MNYLCKRLKVCSDHIVNHIFVNFCAIPSKINHYYISILFIEFLSFIKNNNIKNLCYERCPVFNTSNIVFASCECFDKLDKTSVCRKHTSTLLKN